MEALDALTPLACVELDVSFDENEQPIIVDHEEVTLEESIADKGSNDGVNNENNADDDQRGSIAFELDRVSLTQALFASPPVPSACSPSLLQSLPRQIFVFTSSGKPIFARCGDEDELITIFGLLQAVLSIVLHSQDVIKHITTADRTFVFLLRGSLYFVLVASNNSNSNAENPSILLKQLETIYQQILFILTSKVHVKLENNPGTDLRSLLGTDAKRILTSVCRRDERVSASIALDAVSVVYAERAMREEVAVVLKRCVESSDAAIGLLLHEQHLLSAQQHSSLGFALDTSDLYLLANFVSQSQSLRSGDQHWVPLCLPHFNATGFVQAFISNVYLSESSAPAPNLTLILIATDSDPRLFKNLSTAKRELSEALRVADAEQKISRYLFDTSKALLNKMRDDYGAAHFLFKHHTLSKGRQEVKSALSQFVQADFNFPIDDESLRNRVFIEYENLFLRLRTGSACPESTLFAPTSSSSSSSSSSNISSSERRRGSIQDFFKNARGSRRASGTHPTSDALSEQKEREGLLDANEISACMDEGLHVYSLAPAADHSLAFTSICGMTIVGLAYFDCEIFVCFSNSMSQIECSFQTDALLRSIKTHFSSAAAFVY